MASTFAATDWQPQATIGNHSQRPLSLHAEAPPPKAMQMLPMPAIGGATFSNVLAHSAMHSGLSQEQIAEKLHICNGYMSRFMNGTAQQWAKRLVQFMRTTESLGPLQWMAAQVGCKLVQVDAQSERIAALEAQLAEARRAS